MSLSPKYSSDSPINWSSFKSINVGEVTKRFKALSMYKISKTLHVLNIQFSRREDSNDKDIPDLKSTYLKRHPMDPCIMHALHLSPCPLQEFLSHILERVA
jgi:hypothetical protein